MKRPFKILLFIFICCALINSVSAQSCIGTAGKVKWSYWSNPLQSGYLDLDNLIVYENFPSRPNGSQIVESLQSPINYTDYFGSFMRGYIKVSQTDNYIFNLTCDDKGLFFLSTDQNPANKIKRTEVTNRTTIDQHDNEASQTSVSIQLVAGQYYYFEMYNFEGGASDFMSLFWKKAATPAAPWTIIGSEFIYDYACGQVCPVRGTPCNDGNAQTTNDVQDGFCNCVGTPPTANTCVGQKGLVQAYYYDNIPGTYVENDLINAPKFPLSPDKMEKLKGAYGPIPTNPIYGTDNYGTLIQGYITVPVSGTYEFNITGDNQTIFYLSRNDSIQRKTDTRLIAFFGVGEVEHDDNATQTKGPAFYEKGKYYYFEFRQKENNWRDHFNLYWKTPFHEQRTWKRVPAFYLYDYKCEVSCIAQNTPCNDDNPFTNNDKINATCDCVGTPCSGPDCLDDAAKYKIYDSCSPTDNLTSLSESSWLSCAPITKNNPNSARSSYKNWVLYDFNSPYTFQDTRVWNYNVTGQTNKGFKSVYVDYSLDGTTWHVLGGVYSWPQAPGNSDYAGFAGPNFNEIKARYVLISAAANWGDATCSGFSKITFNASLCDIEGTTCNDNDPLTLYDRFDNNCNCKGVKLDCVSDTIRLYKTTLADGEFKAKKRIVSESLLPNTTDISFTAGNSIILLPGFEVKPNAVFKANITDCLQQAFMANERASTQTEDKSLTDFKIDSTVTAKLKKIIFRLNKPAYVKLVIEDKDENEIATIIDHYYENLGTQIKLLPTTKLPDGLYWIVLEVAGKVLREQLEIKN